ncbi:MAG: ABC transporter ATP-binding protein [Elainellaceae cyanobacterium]
MTASQSYINSRHSSPYADSADTSSHQPLRAVNPESVAIAARNIDMVFRSGKQVYPALQDISLDVMAGEVQLLMGPSGSGKTTLLSILAGILTPTSGHVSILNCDITSMNRRQLAQFRLETIGFIFQGFNLFPALTASENVEVALEVKGYRRSESRKEAHALLEQVGLGHKTKSYPRDLSGGQKQRVAIARALSANPPIIMADEPTAALDSTSGHEVITLLRTLAKEGGTTVLMVTHDPRIVDIADRVTHLEDGKIQP